MVVGKIHSSASISDVLSQYKEADILMRYFNVKSLPCCVSSPLRRDHNPSFGLYVNREGHVRYIDYATSANGGLMDLLCAYWRCSFTQALDRVYSDLSSSTDIHIPLHKAKAFTRSEHNKFSKLEVKVRAWRDFDYDYWRSYGVEPLWLSYAEIYPVSHKVVTVKDSPSDKGRRMVFLADKYAYVFVERKEKRLQLKLYQPFNKKGHKWCSKMDGSVISLWTKIPKSGERVVICSSLKDALCVTTQLHIPALALQGEGYGISDTAANELRRRFKKVFISFDTDTVGMEDSKRLAEKTGFINVIPNLGKEKDFSDYYKSLSDKRDFQKLKSLFD